MSDWQKNGLSKSRVMAHRPCPKRLWLEKFRPELGDWDAGAAARMGEGNKVGELARRLFPGGKLIDADDLGEALALTRQALAAQPRKPIYEATFQHDGVLVRADILLPEAEGAWRMIEVKSSASVKSHHASDIAVQASIVEAAGIRLKRIELAHIDNGFVYRGNGDYNGLLHCVDMSHASSAFRPQIAEWVQAARQTLAGDEPDIAAGDQCFHPFACPFIRHCSPPRPDAFPLELLPRIGADQVQKLQGQGYADIRDIPPGVLTNAAHEKIRLVTCAGHGTLDLAATRAFMARQPWPHYFLDFETINPAIPLWANSRPYQQIPFQWSCHVQSYSGALGHQAFLALGAADPRRAFAESLIAAAKRRGAIFVYNAAFETSRLYELAECFPDLRQALHGVIQRIVDLLAVARAHYYHPDMRGSWSLKAVLPTIAPELAYDGLLVADGGMAQQAYLEMRHPDTLSARREELRKGLLIYCRRDTRALVRLAEFFTKGE